MCIFLKLVWKTEGWRSLESKGMRIKNQSCNLDPLQRQRESPGHLPQDHAPIPHEAEHRVWNSCDQPD